jgi:hypothetical protein
MEEWGNDIRPLIVTGVCRRRTVGDSPLWARNAWFELGWVSAVGPTTSAE